MWESIKEFFPINRVVALLGPFLVAGAATVSAWLADHLPFIADQVDAGEIEAIFLGTAAAGVAALYKWLDNWGKYEEREAEAAAPPAPSQLPAEGGGSKRLPKV